MSNVTKYHRSLHAPQPASAHATPGAQTLYTFSFVRPDAEDIRGAAIPGYAESVLRGAGLTGVTLNPLFPPSRTDVRYQGIGAIRYSVVGFATPAEVARLPAGVTAVPYQDIGVGIPEGEDRFV